MKQILQNIDGKYKAVLKLIGRQAGVCGVHSYVVGGFVRDVLLHRGSGDVDIIIEGNAPEFVRKLPLAKVRLIKTYPAFKTATVEFKGGARIDFASARGETYRYSGALPDVRYGSLKEDLFRRDFTINTLAVCLNSKQFGELVDLFGGVSDLRRKRIRILHEKSFQDDPTRILRAVRYEQRFGFRIEAGTLRLMKEALRKRYDDRVKPERYFNEFRKMLMEERPRRCLERLNQLSGLRFLGLMSVRLRGLGQFERNIRKLNGPLLADFRQWWVIYLLKILEGDFKKAARIATKFNLPREVRQAIHDWPQLKSKVLPGLSKARSGTVYEELRNYSLETVIYAYCDTKSVPVRSRIEKYLKESRFLKLHIDGNDLKRLGIPQGREIKVVLKTVLKDKLNSGLRTKQQEMKRAREIWALMK